MTVLAPALTRERVAPAGTGADWRWPIYGLLLFLPFSGIPIILSYPNTQVTVLLKDVLFIVPAYVAFALSSARPRWSFPGAPVVPMAAFAALVAVESLQQLANPLVPLIGAKVWLFTMPLLVLGYHLPRSRTHLRRLLAATSLVGLVPAVVGIVEAALLDSGRGDLVYPWYGPAARAVTQNFFDAGASSGTLFLRVPSTFSFSAQYYDFLAAMIVVAFAWLSLGGRWPALASLGVVLVAALTCGVKATVVMTPLLLGMTVLIGRAPRGSRASTVVLAGAGLFAVGALALGRAASSCSAPRPAWPRRGRASSTGCPGRIWASCVSMKFATTQTSWGTMAMTAWPIWTYAPASTALRVARPASGA